MQPAEFGQCLSPWYILQDLYIPLGDVEQLEFDDDVIGYIAYSFQWRFEHFQYLEDRKVHFQPNHRLQAAMSPKSKGAGGKAKAKAKSKA